MVKADAYNHGLERVAGYTESYVDRFGVATAEEGARLRAAGISKPVSVFTYTPRDARLTEEYSLTPVIYDLDTLASLGAGVREADVKVDSGMHRLGFSSAEECEELCKLLDKKGIRPRSVCTHFRSAASIPTQSARFEEITAPLKAKYPDIVRHCAASDGILEGAVYDGVRAGRLAYAKAMSVRSAIMDIHRVKRGDCVGYDGAYVAEKDTVVATVFGGYYDGIMRAYSGAEVIVNGVKRRIIGKVCMDMFLIELGDTRAKRGDEVTLIDPATIDSYCKAANATVYEVMTSVKGRARRRYID